MFFGSTSRLGPEAAPSVVWAFWFGPPQQGARLQVFEALKSKIGVPLNLVTDENLEQYIIKEAPPHRAFKYLSPVHKSDYLFAYFSHHVGGGFHDIKAPSGSWAPYFEHLNADNASWIMGTFEGKRDFIACQEPMAADDPACVALRLTRGESATHYKSVFTEFPSAWILGEYDPFDGTRGACCERVRDGFRKLLQCQQHIARPRTPLTSDWLRLADAVLERKYEALKTHPYPFPRCCMNHENGYPINWAELKGNTLFPLELKYTEHVKGGMPHKISSSYRGGVTEDGNSSVARAHRHPSRVVLPHHVATHHPASSLRSTAQTRPPVQHATRHVNQSNPGGQQDRRVAVHARRGGVHANASHPGELQRHHRQPGLPAI